MEHFTNMSKDAAISSDEDYVLKKQPQNFTSNRIPKLKILKKPKEIISDDSSSLSFSDSSDDYSDSSDCSIDSEYKCNLSDHNSSEDDCYIVDEHHSTTKKFSTDTFPSKNTKEYQRLPKKTNQPPVVCKKSLNEKLELPAELSKKLYAHQHEGVQWLYKLYKDGKKGGILADDMGLGKTIQVITYVFSMMKLGLVKKVLLVLPKALIANWKSEFAKWAGDIEVLSYLGHPKERKKTLLLVKHVKECVCITTYGLARNEFKELSQVRWDYTVLDEGHLIKNNNKISKALNSIPSENRIMLTGTPLLNKLVDLWALISWSTQEKILGSRKFFKSVYQEPIEIARQKGAFNCQIAKGNQMAEKLKELTEPFILRRTKESVTKDSRVAIKSEKENKVNCAIFPTLEKKNDFVCWCYLSDFQMQLYNDFLTLPETKYILNSKRSGLAEINVLKQICNHPRILDKNSCIKLGFNTDTQRNSTSNKPIDSLINIPDSRLLNESGKLQFLVELLEQLRLGGHRTTVFSRSRKMLDIIEKVLINRSFKLVRLDGKVNSVKEREHIVKTFQNDDSYNVFLLTAQVGGVGLTLTGADRAVIYDPSWNPSEDNQSIDRIYRIGQKKEVVVYRLITCGSIEEKIYQRQVYKESYIKQTVDNEGDLYRYFSGDQLKKLVYLNDTNESETQKQLLKKHASQSNWSEGVSREVDMLKNLHFSGVSENGLLFSIAADDFDPDSVTAAEKNKIQNSFKVDLKEDSEDSLDAWFKSEVKQAKQLKTQMKQNIIDKQQSEVKRAKQLKTQMKQNIIDKQQFLIGNNKTYQKPEQQKNRTTWKSNDNNIEKKIRKRAAPEIKEQPKKKKAEISGHNAQQGDILGEILGLMKESESFRTDKTKNKKTLKLQKHSDSLSNKMTAKSEAKSSLFNKTYQNKQNEQYSRLANRISYEDMIERKAAAAKILNKNKPVQKANNFRSTSQNYSNTEKKPLAKSEVKSSLFNKAYQNKQNHYQQHSQIANRVSYEAMMERKAAAAKILNKNKPVQKTNNFRSTCQNYSNTKKKPLAKNSLVYKKNISINHQPSFFDSMLKPVNDETLRKKRLAEITTRENGKTMSKKQFF